MTKRDDAMDRLVLASSAACDAVTGHFNGPAADRVFLLGAVNDVLRWANGVAGSRADVMAAWPRVKALATLKDFTGSMKEPPRDFNRDEWAASAVECVLRPLMAHLHGRMGLMEAADWASKAVPRALACAARRRA